MQIMSATSHTSDDSTSISVRKTPPINPNLLNELEEQARGIAEDLEAMFQNLKSQMFEASVLTSASFDVYKQSVENYSTEIKEASNKTRELIELCVQLDKEFVDVQTLASNIKNIKQQVDTLHNAWTRISK
ncbi:BLOC-1-related complex subunit 6 [Gigaspora margarita]|uniref:BLOC-1-related complex subunit 6 n=1 Tax=Gigaspora margarita TaxID=4874 RepID=A0A8H4AKT6_GIGMA|nr:BLOC-1-related complex subunit 6 [Gigaspora margarita]